MKELGKDIDPLEIEIRTTAQRWLNNNKNLLISGSDYQSPRISSEIPDCSMPLSMDTYKFCSLSCCYCFSFFFKANNPAIKNSETGMDLTSINAKKFIAAISGKPIDSRGAMMHKLFYNRKFLLHIGGLADPFCNFEAKNGVGYEIMNALGDLNYPTLFSTKGANVALSKKYTDLFERYAKQNNFAFQVSMVTNDKNMASRVEIGVPSPEQRIELIRRYSAMGYWTILRLRPYIIGITDESIDSLLEDALAAGINAISMEFYALDARASGEAKKRYDWLGKIVGAKNLMEYFARLSPGERGGYRRLNRLVKEIHVKKVYKFCIEHGLEFGCSDPDFKELTTTGSCCGMPDKYEKNHLLENWTRQQMTFHLKEARRIYHLTGKLNTFRFTQVYKDEPYFDYPGLSHDHVCETSMCAADRVNLTYRRILRNYWNNLRSYAAPQNYFHGKVIACGMDENKDLIYTYNPMPYEKHWAEEGIDLKGK
jgi:DNA repair photolyase